MLRSKKGNYADVATWIQFALGFVLVTGIVLVFITHFNDAVQLQNETHIPELVKNASQSYTEFIPKAPDYLFLFMFVVFIGFSVMAARLIPSTPKYIFISIMATIVLPLIALIVENIWDGWYSHSTINTAMSGMIFLPFIMDHLVYFVLFYCLGIFVSLLTKDRGVP